MKEENLYTTHTYFKNKNSNNLMYIYIYTTYISNAESTNTLIQTDHADGLYAHMILHTQVVHTRHSLW